MGADLTGRVEAWRATGASERFRDHEIWVRSITGDDPVLLFLHGYPSSSYDFRTLLPRFAESAVLTFDFLGFGLSDKPRGFAYSLLGRPISSRSWSSGTSEARELFLVAHDMGTSVSTELLARDVEGRGRLPLAGRAAVQRQHRARARVADAGPAPAARRRSARWRRGCRASACSGASSARLFSDAHPLTDEEAADQWSLISPQRRRQRRPRADRLPARAREYADRWHGAIRDWRKPLSLAWGLLDPIATTAVLAALREMRPGVPVDELAELGHYPQIEDPDRVAEALHGALARRAPD